MYISLCNVYSCTVFTLLCLTPFWALSCSPYLKFNVVFSKNCMFTLFFSYFKPKKFTYLMSKFKNYHFLLSDLVPKTPHLPSEKLKVNNCSVKWYKFIPLTYGNMFKGLSANYLSDLTKQCAFKVDIFDTNLRLVAF